MPRDNQIQKSKLIHTNHSVHDNKKNTNYPMVHLHELDMFMLLWNYESYVFIVDMLLL